ncbi:MAG TPA: sensor histidine kinase [Gaiellaceae bacterium]|nr:sensor histidine kinase [Gaiellaceae bacterium]
MSRLTAPFTSVETFRALVYQLATVALGSVALALLIAGWTVTAVLVITPLVVPVLIGFRFAVGSLAWAQGGLARELLGVQVTPPVGSRGQGFWGRGLATVKDGAFWRQQGHLLVSWVVAVVALAPFSLGLQALAVPFYYRFVDGGVDVFWNSNVDTFAESLELVPLGLALVAIGVYLLAPVTKLSRALARGLLAGRKERAVRSPAETRARWVRALSIDALASTAVVVTLVVIWALTGAAYFWPVWPLLSLALVVALPAWIFLVLEHAEIPRLALGSRALAIQIGASAVLLGFLVAVWAITTHGYFWPVWPAVGLAAAAAVHAAVVYGRRQHRIERLVETRAGAVDVQESELRRIERDLHDGAQARLVSLGMSLGLAEQKLESDPEGVRELLAEARRGAGEALEELRDLARGIRPPILTDRGLEPAISALTARTPLPVTLSVDVRRRYPPAVETAAYFTVAEAVANAIKHAHAGRVQIRLAARNGTLVAEVEDDGSGGADPAGPGLTGLRQRAEALDGTLSVASPAGGPTTIRVELPCESS